MTTDPGTNTAIKASKIRFYILATKSRLCKKLQSAYNVVKSRENTQAQALSGCPTSFKILIVK